MTQAERDDLLSRLDSRVYEVHKAVFGNGRPGLCDRMTMAEGDLRGLLEIHSAGREGNKIAWMALLVSMAAVVVMLISAGCTP
jgi:hypothetical protein